VNDEPDPIKRLQKIAEGWLAIKLPARSNQSRAVEVKGSDRNQGYVWNGPRPTDHSGTGHADLVRVACTVTAPGM